MLSFYLDYYPGYREKITMKTIRHEYLGIYIFAHPKNDVEREYNSSLTEKAEAIRCRRYEAVINERYDFFDKSMMKRDFLAYFRQVVKSHNEKWQFVYEHFRIFVKGNCLCEEVNLDLCRRFREYLLNARNIRNKKPMNVNSAASYWSIFRGFLNIAFRDKMIKENPNDYLEKIKSNPTHKESLSLDELRQLYHTPCNIEVLRKAVIFSCLTGMRMSDIINLEWDDIHEYANGDKYLEFYSQKTKARNVIPISKEAYDFISQGRTAIKGRVFEGFKRDMTAGSMRLWLKNAGITKHITFHSFRHTFASLQVELGTDLYTVMRLLAHKNVSTTQIYACHAEPERREAANRISSKLFSDV